MTEGAGVPDASAGAGSHQVDFSAEAIAGYYSNDPSLALHGHGGGGPGYATTFMALLGYRFL